MSDLTRREFSSLLPAALFTTGFAAGLMAPPGQAAEALSSPLPLPGEAVFPDTSAMVDLLLELTRKQYPSQRFTEENLAEIRFDLEQQFIRSRDLAEFPLDQGDEPTPHFSAWRKEK